MRHLKSLRDFLNALREIGGLQDIDQEVDWNLEIGAIAPRSMDLRAPAPLFNRIKSTTASWPTVVRLANVQNGQTWIMAGPRKSPNAFADGGVNTAIHDPCEPCGGRPRMPPSHGSTAARPARFETESTKPPNPHQAC
jgi:hypothetical protein